MAENQQQKARFLKDYQQPNYLIDRTDLEFDIFDEHTVVSAKLAIRAQGDHDEPLVLHGEQLTLQKVILDGVTLSPDQFVVNDKNLIIPNVKKAFLLETSVVIKPKENTELEGLYCSKTMYCTQCEAEGFRKITYYLDQPDVMAKFTTKIIADKSKYPILLSNGNPIERGNLGDERHFVTWHDPFKKPSYLFAMVAGDLASVSDSFVTMSGRVVDLKFYVEHQNKDKCGFAMRSLKNAMRFDEEMFGREYDLDIYMVVAVSDFNMGAMENKGLNIFNTKYVLAEVDTATDEDFRGIEGVIGHEYFHNWTGNRITCRDWFQLSLKEGLTVFRDQEFSAHMGSSAVKRITDVRTLRQTQFLEDAGPMAHPVRPESYIEINNFYTATVYNKGAELIRMMRNLLGKDGFHRGMDLYFTRHDGQAVTCDDFVKAMEDASGIDLTQFKRWYWQAGTPTLEVSDHYNSETLEYTLKFVQTCPKTPGQAKKEPFHIPVNIGLLTGFFDGQIKSHYEQCLSIKEESESFVFKGLKEKPVPSLLRGFSAPVKLLYNYTDEELIKLFAHDTDPFNVWEYGQRFATKILQTMIGDLQQEKSIVVPDSFIEAFKKKLLDHEGDHQFRGLVLTLPSETYIGEQMDVIDVDNIHRGREILRKTLAESLKNLLLETYHQCEEQAARSDALTAGIGYRALKNTALGYLMTLGQPEIIALAFRQSQSPNMTDRIAALAFLMDYDGAERDEALANFYTRFKADELVLDKWFLVQALSKKGDTLTKVKQLMNHPAFSLKNPNKVRSLIGAFSSNLAQFHQRSGLGYQFLAEQIMALDDINPQIAARLVTPLVSFKRYDKERQTMIADSLKAILDKRNLSPNVFEVVSKSLID